MGIRQFFLWTNNLITLFAFTIGVTALTSSTTVCWTISMLGNHPRKSICQFSLSSLLRQKSSFFYGLTLIDVEFIILERGFIVWSLALELSTWRDIAILQEHDKILQIALFWDQESTQ